MSRKSAVVSLRRTDQRAELVSCRLSVVHYDYRNTGGDAVLQVRVTEFLSVVYGGGAGSLLLNVIWIIVSGLPLAIEHLAFGAVLCITVIGIPFGMQHFKMAKLAPFWSGSRIAGLSFSERTVIFFSVFILTLTLRQLLSLIPERDLPYPARKFLPGGTESEQIRRAEKCTVSENWRTWRESVPEPCGIMIRSVF